MKRKYVIIPLILGCYLLAGCNASSNESSNTFSGTEMVTDQDDPIADISKIEQIFIDEYSRQNDNLQCVWHADRLTDNEWNDHYNKREDEDEYSWLIPQADHDNFTAEEKKQIEEDTLHAATKVWELYENVTVDGSLPSYSSGIVDFTKEQRIEVLEALGQLGLISVTEDANTQNGELFKQFYDDYLNGKTGNSKLLCRSQVRSR